MDKPWSPPEGMVECEVGPVLRCKDVLSGKEVLVRIVGHTPSRGTLEYRDGRQAPLSVPIARPCNDDGSWCS